MINFNVNHIVKVQLTKVGRGELRKQHDELYGDKRYEMEFTLPKEDSEGWSQWQLWDLMSRLGHLMRLGGSNDLPIKTEIKFEEDQT